MWTSSRSLLGRLAPTACWTLALTLVVLTGNGCATPVGVTQLDEQAAHRELNANILSAGKPSDFSTQILERTALSERFKHEPEFVLAEMNSGLGQPDERDRLFALAELFIALPLNVKIGLTIFALGFVAHFFTNRRLLKRGQ